MEKKKTGKLSVFYSEKHIADYDIFVGKNIVGRTSEKKKSDIEISEDEYLCRQHFIIEVCVNKHGHFEYLACYNNARNKTVIFSGKRERELRKAEKIMLSDGDKIVAGKTTFVLGIEKVTMPEIEPNPGGNTVLAE